MANNRRRKAAQRYSDPAGASGTDAFRPAATRPEYAQDSGFRYENGRVVDEGGQPVRMVKTGTAIDLGDLAPAEDVEEVTATFRLRGTEFRVHPDLSELVIADLLDKGQQIDQRDPRAMTFVKDYAFAHVHPDDQATFWETVIRLRWDSTQIMVLCWQILDGITENPTGEQSDSSGGPLETSQSSVPASSSPAAAPSSGTPRNLHEAFTRQIERIQARTDEDGQVLPINAAVAAQLVVAAKARGVDLEPQSHAATA